MLLRMLRILPSRARADVDTLVQQVARELPVLMAAISLSEAIPSKLRRFFAVNGLELLENASEEERVALSSAIIDWSTSHAEEASRLAAASTKAA